MAEGAESSRLWCKLRRLNFTPWGDLVRGKITGRFDFYSQLRAVFPEPLAKHLLKIIRRAHLDISEQALVTQELIQRFGKRLNARRSVGSLIFRLDYKRSAKSVRRKYRGQRRLIRRIFDKILIGIAYSPLVLIGLYPCAMVFFWFSRPTLSIDYLTQLNSPALAVPEVDRAWPIYREAVLGLSIHDDSIRDLQWYGCSPYHPLWEDTVAYLREHQDELALAQDAAAKPGLGLIVRHNGQYERHDAMALYGPSTFDPDVPAMPQPSLWGEQWQTLYWDVYLPYPDLLRSLGWLMAADAYLAMEEGDPDRFCDRIETIIGIACHATEHRCLANAYIANSIRFKAYETITDVLVDRSDLLSDQHLSRLARLLNEQANLPHVSVDGSRIILMDMIQKIYSENGGGGWLTPEGIWLLSGNWNDDVPPPVSILRRIKYTAMTPLAAWYIPARRNMTERVESRIAQFENDLASPIWEVTDSGIRIENMCGNQYPLYHMTPDTLVLFDGTRRIIAINEAMRSGVFFGIALEQYRREHGTWPVSLDALPHADMFIDPMTGERARYKIVDGRPILYSVGSDRDDDGGRLPVREYDGEYHDDVGLAQRWDVDDPEDGDWVLFPHPDTPRVYGLTTTLPGEDDMYGYGMGMGYGDYSGSTVSDEEDAEDEADASAP